MQAWTSHGFIYYILKRICSGVSVGMLQPITCQTRLIGQSILHLVTTVFGELFALNYGFFYFYLNIPWSAGLYRSSYFSVDRFQSLVWFVFSFDPQHFCSSLWVVVLLVVCLLSPRPTDPVTQHNKHKMRNWEWKKGNDFSWWKTGLPCNKCKHTQISTWWPNWGECISINKWTRHHTITERVNSRLIYCIFGTFYLGHC